MMNERILRVVVCPSKFYALSNLSCGAVEFHDAYEDYFKYLAEEVLCQKYDCTCIVEYCVGSQYGVQFLSDDHNLKKQAFEDYSTGEIDSLVPDFESFVDVDIIDKSTDVRDKLNKMKTDDGEDMRDEQ